MCDLVAGDRTGNLNIEHCTIVPNQKKLQVAKFPIAAQCHRRVAMIFFDDHIAVPPGSHCLGLFPFGVLLPCVLRRPTEPKHAHLHRFGCKSLR
eukprot:9249293-Karenia_brevis.AAC.1